MKSANLTFEDICDIRAIFDYLDSDDGTLSDSEALKVWSRATRRDVRMLRMFLASHTKGSAR